MPGPPQAAAGPLAPPGGGLGRRVSGPRPRVRTHHARALCRCGSGSVGGSRRSVGAGLALAVRVGQSRPWPLPPCVASLPPSVPGSPLCPPLPPSVAQLHPRRYLVGSQSCRRGETIHWSTTRRRGEHGSREGSAHPSSIHRQDHESSAILSKPSLVSSWLQSSPCIVSRRSRRM